MDDTEYEIEKARILASDQITFISEKYNEVFAELEYFILFLKLF